MLDCGLESIGNTLLEEVPYLELDVGHTCPHPALITLHASTTPLMIMGHERLMAAFMHVCTHPKAEEAWEFRER